MVEINSPVYNPLADPGARLNLFSILEQKSCRIFSKGKLIKNGFCAVTAQKLVLRGLFEEGVKEKMLDIDVCGLLSPILVGEQCGFEFILRKSENTKNGDFIKGNFCLENKSAGKLPGIEIIPLEAKVLIPQQFSLEFITPFQFLESYEYKLKFPLKIQKISSSLPPPEIYINQIRYNQNNLQYKYDQTSDLQPQITISNLPIPKSKKVKILLKNIKGNFAKKNQQQRSTYQS